MARMTCPYDQQQCEHPKCIDPTLQNYYDSRCAAALAAVVTDQKEVASPNDSQMIEAINLPSQGIVTIAKSQASKIEDVDE